MAPTCTGLPWAKAGAAASAAAGASKVLRSIYEPPESAANASGIGPVTPDCGAMPRLRVATWNINSLRLRPPLLDKLREALDPDVICLQETKVPDELFPDGVPGEI